MTPENARKLVDIHFPKYEVFEDMYLADAARPMPAVEIISPSLRKLKQLYFQDNAGESAVVEDDDDDSGIVQVAPKKPTGTFFAPEAVVFSKGLKIGGTG